MNDQRLLLRVVSEPINRMALQQMRATQQRIALQSRLVRVLRTSDKLRAGGEGAQPAPSLALVQLAAALQNLPAIRDDPELARASRETRQTLSLPLFAGLYWLETSSLQIRYPLPLRAGAYQRWWQRHGPPHLRQADRLLEAAEGPTNSRCRFCDKQFGVTLIGHAFDLLGLGEYLRMMARALEAARIPYCVIDVPLRRESPHQDRSLEGKALGKGECSPYAFNIFCMTAESHLHQAIHHGLAPDASAYSIATWFWEMEHWPDSLTDALDLADEYWPCTRIIDQALRGACTRREAAGIEALHSPPILLMPQVIELGTGSQLSDLGRRRQETRSHFGLDPDAVLFSFVFDLSSTITRKNPQAVLEAFRLAFGEAMGDHTNIGLVIKTFPPRSAEPLWEALKRRAAADPRIRLIEADLDRNSLLALFACCDVFVSLHRSEGLGLGMAEALQLGLDVIATDYGGNTDFCSGPLAHPVPYELIPVQPGEYHHHQGMVWAEPDLKTAANLMQQLVKKRRHNLALEPGIAAAYRDRFSAAGAGARFRERLEQLWQQRDQIQSQLERGAGSG